MTLIETLGSLLIVLIVIAGAALGLNSAFSSSKLADMEQGIVTMRMQVQHMYSGSSDYSGLDNALALKAGVVPKQFVKGNTIKNPFGGDVTISPSPDNSAFSIQLTNVPQEQCTKLARFQTDAWLSVDINGTTIDTSTGTVADIIANITNNNTITFTAR